jgi:hypothetical protein
LKIEILEEAYRELDEAIAYHENIEPGLGIRLKDEARAVIHWIFNNAELPPLRAKGYRRVNFRVFPYYVAYFKLILSVSLRIVMAKIVKPTLHWILQEAVGTSPTRNMLNLRPCVHQSEKCSAQCSAIRPHS